MITLPRKIEATGFECLVASVIMVTMYWRLQDPTLEWDISANIDGAEWATVLQRGISKIKNSGMPFNTLKRYLRSLRFPLTAKLEYLQHPSQLTRLFSFDIPPIVLYDRYYMLKGIPREPHHAVVLVDKTQENFISVDPSLGPKFQSSLSENDFAPAWAMTRNATIIITPRRLSLRRRIRPSITLDRWLGKN